MSRLFFGNFDFEYQLVAPAKSPPLAARRRNTELAPIWVSMAQPGDAWADAPVVDEEFQTQLEHNGLVWPGRFQPGQERPQSLELTPWGWSQTVVTWARRHRLSIAPPPLDVVRRVNSRRFSVELEREFAVDLPGTAVVRDETQLRDALRRVSGIADRWLLKAEFGMAGRERVPGCAVEPNATTLNWVRRKFAEGQAVVVEPWVEIVAEAGLQFDVPVHGPPILLGVTSLLTDGSGVYRGSRFDDAVSDRAEWAPAIAIAERVTERLQSLGYFGPLGVDVGRYRARDGAVRFRPLQDVNARYTMGRLSLGFGRLLRPGEAGVWLHQRWPTESPDAPRKWFDSFCTSLPQGTRVVRTSPFVIEGRPVAHGSVVVIRDSESAIEKEGRWVEP